jgi:hypothetical protein
VISYWVIIFGYVTLAVFHQAFTDFVDEVLQAKLLSTKSVNFKDKKLTWGTEFLMSCRLFRTPEYEAQFFQTCKFKLKYL